MPIMPSTPNLRYHHGFSLVELMISVSIGLFLILGLSTLLVNSSRSRTELEKTSRQIENGRYATQLLRDAITHAGYYGEYFCQSDTASPTLCTTSAPSTPLTSLPDPCLTTLAGLSYTRGLPLPIQGYDSSTLSTVPTCVGSANHKAGTDILVIRRANTNVTPTASVVDGRIFIQANPLGYIIAKRSGGTWSYQGTSVGTDDLNATGAATLPLLKKDGATSADLRNYVVQIYFVSPCSIPAGGGNNCTGASDDNGTPIPTLKMIELSADHGLPVMSEPVPLVEGIDNLQLDFGIDTDADGAPNSFSTCSTSTPCSLTDWSNVVAIRVNVLARNTEPTIGYTDVKRYDLGLAGLTTAANDTYKRHAYSILVRAVNPSGRREH